MCLKMLFFSSNPFYDNCRNSRALAYGLIFIVNKRADLQIYNLCDASTRTTILLVKKQIEVSFSCVCSTHTHTWVFHTILLAPKYSRSVLLAMVRHRYSNGLPSQYSSRFVFFSRPFLSRIWVLFQNVFKNVIQCSRPTRFTITSEILACPLANFHSQ